MSLWASGPAILIFGDSDEGVDIATEQAVASGGRIAAVLPLDQAMERLDHQLSVDLVILDVSVDHGPMLDRLLRRVDEGAANGLFSGVVNVTADLVDVVSARIGHSEISLVVGRDGKALEAAIGERLRRPVPELRENDDDQRSPLGPGGPMGEPEDALQGAGQGLGQGAEADPAPVLPAAAGGQPVPSLYRPNPAMIRDMIRSRRLREELLGSGLFADPAWDMLLDLTAARLENRPVAVSSLCIAAAVPATTALRWIKQLTDAGLLRPVADPDDGRRVFIELTERAAEAMDAYFASLPRGILE